MQLRRLAGVAGAVCAMVAVSLPGERRCHGSGLAATCGLAASTSPGSPLTAAPGVITAFWKVRRAKVVAQILGERLDVLGVQEANQSTVYKNRLSDGANQYLDLRGALNRKGAKYALTNTKAYNCANPSSTYKCRKKNQNASGSNRILYNTRTVSMLKQGAVTYSAKASGKPSRFLAWAILEDEGDRQAVPLHEHPPRPLQHLAARSSGTGCIHDQQAQGLAAGDRGG